MWRDTQTGCGGYVCRYSPENNRTLPPCKMRPMRCCALYEGVKYYKERHDMFVSRFFYIDITIDRTKSQLLLEKVLMEHPPNCWRPSWSWLYDGWIYNYLCNQCLSPLTLWVWILFHGVVYSIQHNVIKFVSDLRLVGCFLWVLRFPPPMKLTATI
jgi:hypothetical protein